MRRIKLLILNMFRLFGYNLVKETPKNIYFSHLQENIDSAFQRLALLQKYPEIIIDLGAAKGTWTKKAIQYWPDAEYELVEPITEQIDCIPLELKDNPKIHVTEAVAGATQGMVDLTITPDLDGSGIYGGKAENLRKVKVITVDELIRGKPGNVLLKLDTHGYELPIFEGAKETLNRTEIIIVEVYGFYIAPTAQIFHEVSDYLYKKDFRLYDIVEIMRRPVDNAFWQADAVYLRKDSMVFSNNTYV